MVAKSKSRPRKPTTKAAPAAVFDRASGLGGTDVAAILGVHPYKNEWRVYAEKTGTATIEPPSARMAVGLAVEPVIRRLYSASAGREVIPLDLLRDPARPFLYGHPDGAHRGEPVIFEAKHVESPRQIRRWGREGSDEIPAEYLIQVLWYLSLAATDPKTRDIFDDPAGEARVAALLSGTLRVYVVRRDPEAESILIEKAERWWLDRIVGGNPPPVDGSEGAADFLRARYPRGAGTYEIPAAEVPEWRARAEAYVSAKSAREAAEGEEERLKQEIQSVLGDRERAEAEGLRIDWPTHERKSTDWKGLSREARIPLNLVEKFTKSSAVRRFTVEVDS